MKKSRGESMPKVFVILGPTGVGKTGASIVAAEKLNTEVISADSMQIYRYMDIGTAKPAVEQRRAVKHHMIDIVDPSGAFSSGVYMEKAVPILQGLVDEGRVPVIVGGAGLYIKAMTRGLFSAPGADWSLREELLSMEKDKGGTLYKQLRELDPEAAERIEHTDLRRIVRALEVCIKTKKPVSGLRRQLTVPLPYTFIKTGLTRERTELYRIIEERVDEMITAGLVDEVERVLQMNPCRTAMQAIGYKEIALYLKGVVGFDEAVWMVKRASKRYAKRQGTWFKKEEGIHWIDITGMRDDAEIGGWVLDALNEKLLY